MHYLCTEKRYSFYDNHAGIRHSNEKLDAFQVQPRERKFLDWVQEKKNSLCPQRNEREKEVFVTTLLTRSLIGKQLCWKKEKKTSSNHKVGVVRDVK